MQEIFYIIVGLPRTGNTFTHLGVAEHPQVSACIDEVDVDPFFTQGMSVFTKGNERPSEKAISHMELFKCMASFHDKKDIRAYGLHTVIASLKEAEDFVHRVQANYPDVRIILVQRLNPMAQLASLIHAERTGVYMSF